MADAADDGAMKDRVGLGWRSELAASIFSHLDEIDILEVVADDYFHAPRERIRSIRTLAAQIPVSLHGVSMGLASTVPVERARLESMARLVDAVQPESWSEHLAFVRGGGVEIGHLAAPPRTRQSSEGAQENIYRAQRTVGMPSSFENVATLIRPPASTMDEPEWMSAILTATGAGLLLDLHNLYANAVNFGDDPCELLLRCPLDRVKTVHLSGGRWIREPAVDETPPGRRLLDDHLHDVPSPVFDMLVLLAQRVDHPLTVLLERDGEYPSFDLLLQQLTLARQALAEGRRKARTQTAAQAT